jgi:hypothetical protein
MSSALLLEAVRILLCMWLEPLGSAPKASVSRGSAKPSGRAKSVRSLLADMVSKLVRDTEDVEILR